MYWQNIGKRQNQARNGFNGKDSFSSGAIIPCSLQILHTFSGQWRSPQFCQVPIFRLEKICFSCQCLFSTTFEKCASSVGAPGGSGSTRPSHLTTPHAYDSPITSQGNVSHQTPISCHPPSGLYPPPPPPCTAAAKDLAFVAKCLVSVL